MFFNYSVIIPYRDKYDLLLKAVNSIVDRNDIQVIIIDNSEKPLASNQIPSKIESRVDYLTSSPQGGAGCARNVGLSKAIGRFLLFLDADDYFTADAFDSFDKYLDKNYDIVFFKAESVFLKDGSRSNRHSAINQLIDDYNNTGDDNLLRYKFENPISKLIRTSLVKNNCLLFDEIRVSNDVWFSVMTGHFANTITADTSVVYVITTGESGSSLTLTKSKDNWFIRYQVAIRVNLFLKSVGMHKYRNRLIGYLRISWKEYGLKEFLRYLKYAYKNRVSLL